MKKLSLLSIITLLSIFFIYPASAESDTRYFQYSQTDIKHPDGFPSALALKSIQFAITDDAYVQFFVFPQNLIDENTFSGNRALGIAIDINRDKSIDYNINSGQVKYDDDTKVDAVLFKYSGSQSSSLEECQASSWITPSKDAVAFEFPRSCIPWKSDANIMGFAMNGDQFDFAPEPSTPLTVKTNYLEKVQCKKSSNNIKLIYDKVQYICTQKSGKWQYVDYGPIAAAKAKYLTEKAFYSCNLHTKSYGAVLSDGGKTLVLDHVYKYFVTEKEFKCVVAVLGMPSSVTSQISMTRALDGMRSAKWGKLTAFWNYHPDDGLGITITYN